MDEHKVKDQAGNDRGPVTFTVANEDDGRSYSVQGSPGEIVGHVIGELYRKLGRTRSATDRLRCEKTGVSVFNHEQMKVRDYLEAGHCADLAWIFTGPTGGA